MKSLWFRLLVLWYRLTGSTATQADWRARQATQAPKRVRGEVAAHVRRAHDGRFNCACGQLLTEGDRVCHACGRRQWLPPALRRIGRLLGFNRPSPTLGTTIAAVSMVLGFVVQLRISGSAALMGKVDGLALLESGAWSSLIPFEAQPWRPLTYTFAHGGLMHLGFNALALMQIGPAVERWVGFARFMTAWVGAAVAGVLGPQLFGFGGGTFVIGASGSVFGLIGVALMLGHRSGTTEGRALRDAMVKWVIYATVFGFMMGGVAHSAHFGGLAAGFVVALAFGPGSNPHLQKRLTPVLGALSLGAFAAAVVGFVVWHAGGARPPAQMNPDAAAEWLMLKVDRDGLEAVLPEGAVRLIQRADRLRREDAPSAELEALIDAEVPPLFATLTEPEKRVVGQRLRQALGVAAPDRKTRRDPHRRPGTADMP